MAFWKKKPKEPNPFPDDNDTLDQGVYNLWRSSYLARSQSYCAMENLLEYFVLTPLPESKTHVVRVVRDIKCAGTPCTAMADYLNDSRVLSLPPTELHPGDVMDAFPHTPYTTEYSKPQDKFGLRYIGTLETFVNRLKNRNIIS